MTKTVKETFEVTITNDASLDAAIVVLGTEAKALKHKLHSLLVSTVKVHMDIAHAANKIDDKEAIVASGLVCVARINAIQASSSYHTKAISVWISLMLPFTWSLENKVWYFHKEESDIVILGSTFKTLRDEPFWEVSPPQAAKPTLMLEELDKLLKKFDKAVANPAEGDEMALSALKHIREARKAAQEEQDKKVLAQKLKDAKELIAAHEA
jgi:hypothetical protein